MLLRSASTPFLNPWKPHLKEASPEAEIVHQIPKFRPLALCASSKSLPPPLKRSPIMDGGLCCTDCSGAMVSVLVDGGEGRGGGCGGDGGDDSCSGSWDADRDNEKADLYYQKIIEANPENSLLLSNYARFLKEVRGDLIKAEEYCGRAISADPNDGNVLSMYADLIWNNHKDASRAQSYHVQAAKASPEDSFVLASYAQFLWDDDDDEDEDDEEVDCFCEPCSPTFAVGVQPQLTPLTAAS